jgi:hypothetical protein
LISGPFQNNTNLNFGAGKGTQNVPNIQQEEIRALVPPTIFFFMTLNSFALVRVLMPKGARIPLSTPVQTAVDALILGNAVLIAAMLRFISRYPGKPLVYDVAWKTTTYALVVMLLHYFERLVASGGKPELSLPAIRSCLPRSCSPASVAFRSSW